MSALDLVALRRWANDVIAACEVVASVTTADGWAAFNSAVALRDLARAHLATALSPDVVLALLDRLERAERAIAAMETYIADGNVDTARALDRALEEVAVAR